MSKKRRVTKVQLVDEKGATPKTPMLDYVLKLIPLLLIFGVIHQLWALYSIWKMGALAFFSWSQVINDTVVLLPFAALVIGNAWMWALSYGAMLWIYKDDGCIHRRYFFRALAVTFVCLISALMFSAVEVFAYSEWLFTTFWSAMKLSALFFAIAFFSTLGYSLVLRSNDIYIQRLAAFLVTIVVSGIGLTIILPIMQHMLASNWCSWKWDQYTMIKYMNDKYFFSSGAILNDSGALIWSGTAVYVRNDENKFVHCGSLMSTQPGLKK